MTIAIARRNSTDTAANIDVAFGALHALFTDTKGASRDPELFTEDFRAYGPAREIFGTCGHDTPGAHSCIPFTNSSYDVRHLDVTGDRVTVHIVFNGHHTGCFQGMAPTGQEVEGRGVVSLKVRGTRVSEAASVLTWGPAGEKRAA